MRAKITDRNGYTIAMGGHRVTTFAYGDIVEGYVAEKAIRAHRACAMFPDVENKIEPPLQTKRKAK
jgi:hypothetical protein